MIQSWSCDVCGQSGETRLSAKAGVWEAAKAILQAHRRKVPGCSGSSHTVRVKANVVAKAVGKKKAIAR